MKTQFKFYKINLISLVSVVVLTCMSGTACAAKHVVKTAKPVSTLTESADTTQISTSALGDVAMGLLDFEKRASKYNSEEWNFALGYAHFRHGHLKEAEEFFGKVADKLSLVSDHILYYRSAIANRQGRHKEALVFLDELKKNADSAWETEAKLERARALIPLGIFKEARSELENYKRAVEGEKAFDADLLIAKSFIEEGDASSAINYVRSLAVTSDSEEKLKELEALIEEVKQKFKSDTHAWLEEPIQQYHLAESFFSRSQWDAAASSLEKLISRRSLDSATQVQAKWLLARCLRSIHRYDEAIALMEDLLKNPSAKSLSESVMSTLATTYTKKNEYAKAIDLRRRMMGRYPAGSAAAAQMAYKIAFLYMDEGKYEEAIPLWQQMVAIKGGGEKRVLSGWYLAWSYYMLHNNAAALSTFDRMLASVQNSRDIHDRILYWKGRALENLGKKEDASKVFSELMASHPNGYYAELSFRRIKGDKRSTEDFIKVHDTKGYAGEWKTDLTGADKDPAHIARANFFDKLGLHEEVGRELKAFYGRGRFNETEGYMWLASKNFVHDVNYRIAETSYRDLLRGSPDGATGFDRFIWEAAYPKAYYPVVSMSVRDSAVEPFLVWSIMRNESAFRPEVISPAGAVGLLQLMPTTANRLAAESGSGNVDRRDLYKPAVNIAWGTAYLKKLSKIFPGNPVAWIASYNAGEEAVGRWLKNGTLNDIEEWIEEIPYDETNLYVKKVLVSYWKYQKLYGR